MLRAYHPVNYSTKGATELKAAQHTQFPSRALLTTAEPLQPCGRDGEPQRPLVANRRVPQTTRLPLRNTVNEATVVETSTVLVHTWHLCGLHQRAGPVRAPLLFALCANNEEERLTVLMPTRQPCGLPCHPQHSLGANV